MTTSSQYQSSSPDGLPPRDSLSLGGSAPLQDSAPSSGSKSPPSSHFSAYSNDYNTADMKWILAKKLAGGLAGAGLLLVGLLGMENKLPKDD
jgi:hypothetical protein